MHAPFQEAKQILQKNFEVNKQHTNFFNNFFGGHLVQTFHTLDFLIYLFYKVFILNF